jgi:hypothetical protein
MKAMIYKESDSSYEDIKEVNTIEDLLLISQNYSLFIGEAFDYEKDKGCNVAITICDGDDVY